MTRSQLHRCIAHATGEDVSVIRRLGFSLLPLRRRPHGRNKDRCRRRTRHAGRDESTQQ
jgi:hypothetical protein